MPTIVRITDPADPRVDVYRDQRDAWLRARHNPDHLPGATGTGYSGGLFMAESRLVLDHLLQSEHETLSLLLTPERAARLADRLKALPERVPVYIVERAVLESICGHDVHRGVLACGRRLPEPDPFELARSVRTLLVLEDLSNHDNVGGMFRSAAALGGLGEVGVLLSPKCCDPLYRKAIRVSMGLALRVPFATLADWPADLGRLRAQGWRVLALTPADDAVELGELEPPSSGARDAVLVGAEGPGLTRGSMEASDVRVRIAIDPGVDSLNAVVAGSIALHAVCAMHAKNRRTG